MTIERLLQYDETRWEEVPARLSSTLQLFITNKCNLRCKACFYADNLGKDDMPLEDYKEHVMHYKSRIQKVILLGGEPTLHKDIGQMVSFNRENGLRTTIYTNGARIKRLESIDMADVELRVGVYGSHHSEKPLDKIDKVSFPITIVYMLRKDNVCELMETADMAEEYNCKRFFISSIRDIADTGSFWDDNEDTLPLGEYADVLQDFVLDYKGSIELNISKRGVLKGKKEPKPDKCRFGNIFPDKKMIICPFDISLKKYADELCFNERQCNKNSSCLLMKIVLKPIPEDRIGARVTNPIERPVLPDKKKFRDGVKKMADEFDSWPEWKQRGVAQIPEKEE